MTAADAAAGSGSDQTLIHSLSREELDEVCRALGAPAFRADQIWHWLYPRACSAWAEMKNLPAALRAELARRFTLDSAVALQTEGSPGETRKILVRLSDGEQVEQVLIPAPRRRTVCVSTQAGCRYACAFCASGRAGFGRNLLAGEIVGQVLTAARLFGGRPTHVVFMGIGEPLDNYDQILKAIRILNHPAGLAIGARRMTISTCGLAPAIRRLAGEGLQVELSVSLHAPRDELRSRLMPVNRKYPLAELLAACREYTAATKRLITFEYTLIGGVNDAEGDAEELARRLADLPARVNLIPLSPVEEFAGRPAPPEAAARFIRVLARAGINATRRVSKGCARRAACGQLRYRGHGRPAAASATP